MDVKGCEAVPQALLLLAAGNWLPSNIGLRIVFVSGVSGRDGSGKATACRNIGRLERCASNKYFSEMCLFAWPPLLYMRGTVDGGRGRKLTLTDAAPARIERAAGDVPYVTSSQQRGWTAMTPLLACCGGEHTSLAALRWRRHADRGRLLA